MKKGLLIVLSGPSGAGKGTVCYELLQQTDHMQLSISCTTRQPRKGEEDGVNYFFKQKQEFERMIQQDAFLEYAQVFDNYYGTPREKVQQALDAGKDVLLEIDVQGAMRVKEKCPEGVFIFLVPPSLEILEQRIRSRATESEEQIQKRLSKAGEELSLIPKYDYVIVNDTVAEAVKLIQCLVKAEKCRVQRNGMMVENLLKGGEVH